MLAIALYQGKEGAAGVSDRPEVPDPSVWARHAVPLRELPPDTASRRADARRAIRRRDAWAWRNRLRRSALRMGAAHGRGPPGGL